MQLNPNTKILIPGLDGIRALAVTAVILFHEGINNLVPGGYLGVDVFFTLSGFLITSLILNEATTNGSFSFQEFLKRRFKRLYPALLAVVVTCCIYSIFFANDSLKPIKNDLLPSIFYYSNFHQLINELPYFEQFERRRPFQHLWSLAVEMHFYLIWPILFVSYTIERHNYYKYLILFLAVMLTIWGIYLASDLNIPLDTNPEKFYFRTDTRVANIIFGAFLAFCFQPTSQGNYKFLKGPFSYVAGWGSLMLLIIAFIMIDESFYWLYRGGFSIISLATCYLIVYTSSEDSFLYRIFNFKFMSWLGARSYSLYLWHWPVYSFFRTGEELPGNPYVSAALRILLTIVLADLTFRFIETRFKGRISNAYGTLSRIVYVSFAVMSTSVFFYIALADSKASGTHTILTQNNETYTGPNTLMHDDETSEVSKNLIAPQISHNNLGEKLKIYPFELTDMRITAIGDSVMLGTRPTMVRHLPIYKLDAAVGRQGSDALKLIKELKSSGQISNEVLLHIGTNGYVYEQHLRQILELLADRKKVVIFNIQADRRWSQPNNQLFKKYSLSYPDYVFVDWEKASANHPEFFVKDGIHLSTQGMLMFTKLAKEAFGVPDVPKELLLTPTQAKRSPKINISKVNQNNSRLEENPNSLPIVVDDADSDSRTQH